MGQGGRGEEEVWQGGGEGRGRLMRVVGMRVHAMNQISWDECGSAETYRAAVISSTLMDRECVYGSLYTGDSPYGGVCLHRV